MMNANQVKTSADILNRRLERIAELRKLGGRLGTVCPSLAGFLLGLSASRVRDLIQTHKLCCQYQMGFRLVSLASVLEFARASNKRTRNKPLLKQASQW